MEVRILATADELRANAVIAMPIYEYRCDDCGRRTTILLRSFSENPTVRCERCQSHNVRKLVSRVAVLRSEEERFERLADPSLLGDVDENDPKSVARWARRLGQEMGEDLGDDFDEMVDQIEAGTVPDDESGSDDESIP